MKRIITGLFLLISIASFGQRFDDLTLVDTANGLDQMYIKKKGVTNVRRIELSHIKNYVLKNAGFDTTAIGVDSLGKLYWKTTGNAGTNTATNYLGTSDSVGFLIKTKGVTRTTINADGSRSDTYTGTNGRTLTNSFSGSAYLSSYGTGNFIYSGDLAFAGKGDSALWARWKRISLQTYSGGSIEIISNNHLTASAINNVKRTAGNLIYDKAKNGVYVGNNDTIIAANSYSSSVIIGSDNCHIDSGGLNSIIGSYQCAIRGVGTNPLNTMAHSLILGGYLDTTHCYHEIAIGAGAVENRSPYFSGGWDNRDLYLSMGNYGNSVASIDSEQSNLIIIKNGNMAIGSALRAVDIPATTDAMLHIHGSLQVEDGTQSNGYVYTSNAQGLGSWRPTTYTALDSVTIYASTPAEGTYYRCTNCTANGLTGASIVSYLASAWRRIFN